MARKLAVSKIRIDHHSRGGQIAARQMVIGNQDRNAEALGFCDTGDAGHAVIDRDEQGGRAPCCNADYFRGEAVAKLETIRHEIIDLGETEVAKTTQNQCRRSRGPTTKPRSELTVRCNDRPDWLINA